jgi:hypothetical protein
VPRNLIDYINSFLCYLIIATDLHGMSCSSEKFKGSYRYAVVLCCFPDCHALMQRKRTSKADKFFSRFW